MDREDLAQSGGANIEQIGCAATGRTNQIMQQLTGRLMVIIIRADTPVVVDRHADFFGQIIDCGGVEASRVGTRQVLLKALYIFAGQWFFVAVVVDDGIGLQGVDQVVKFVVLKGATWFEVLIPSR